MKFHDKCFDSSDVYAGEIVYRFFVSLFDGKN